MRLHVGLDIAGFLYLIYELRLTNVLKFVLFRRSGFQWEYRNFWGIGFIGQRY